MLSPKDAYALASQWGSYINDSDPGTCFYSFHPDDGRPVSEEHRGACLDYLADILATWPLGQADRAELHRLTEFFRAAELRG